MRQLLPHDGLVWAMRERSWSEWARWEWSDHTAVARAMSRRGWRRDDCGRLTRAPCLECGRSVEVEVLDWTRRCEACRYGPMGRELAEEIVAFVERHPEYKEMIR